MSEYQRYNREDPRLRQSPKETPAKSPSRDPRTRTASNSSNWDAQNNQLNQFGQPQSIQTAYQHLQPNNVYNNSNQYANQGYYGGYGNYSYNPYQYPSQGGQSYIAGVGQPGPPGDEYPQSGWAPVQTYDTQNPSTDFKQNNTALDNIKTSKSEGVAEEVIKQKAGLLKERETYEARVASLSKKLKILVEQKDELQGKRSPDRETLHIIKENTKLQVEIQSKIKDANNVIEILSGLIGDKKSIESAKEESGGSEKKDEKVNYMHYDPEIHWCRMCDVFPQSAKELLVHLHSKQHQQIAQEEIPWHKLPPEPKCPVYENAPVRRLPIKGLQFFVASTAWYCRLCDAWIGDLHCASQHLMSLAHSQNYSNFVEQNPHWEIEWLKDREKALERIKRSKASSDSEDRKKRRRKEKYSPSSLLSKDKKKKKRRKKRKHSTDSSSSSSSSSSSEDEDKSKSIRVAMRNKIKLLSDKEEKLDILGKLVEEERKRQEKLANPPKPEDSLMSQWMTVSEPPVTDKHLLDSLKEKLKHKQDIEKAKVSAERESLRRAKEKEEYEVRAREKERQQSFADEEEEDDKKRDKMSMKLKEQSKISKRDSYSRRRSSSRSPKHRRSRSPSPDRRKYERNGSQRSFDRSPHMRYNKDEDKSDKKSRKLPFIAKMPLFKNQKLKKPDEDKKEKEIQKEDYDIPRKTRFQPGNLARAFIPEPEVVCFPKLSSYPPIAPPPPAITTPAVTTPAPPQISLPKPPPPPKLDQTEKVDETDYSALYEENYNYGNVDYSMMSYQAPPQSFNFMQVLPTAESEVPRSHTLPLQPPPLPPDDPNDDLAMLGISSDDMAVQQMY